MDSKRHWETVYGSKAPEALSWYRPHLERSLTFIESAGLGRTDGIIDIGGGSSTLVDDLLDRGYRNVAVLDISSAAIERAQERLGARAKDVTWLVGDITTVELPPARYAFWHDRAVFHFLTSPEDRRRYVIAAKKALSVNGRILVATFGPEGPEQCSGLDVARYDPDALHGEFGRSFEKIGSSVERHITPWGTEQEFVYCFCRMEA
jgi:SAM-dependent methyltransferase